MTVFKGFLRLVKRNLGTQILFMAIFLGICISIQVFTGGKGMEGFQEENLDIAVIDRDGGPLAQSLARYLGRHHRLVDVADDPDVIQEELFYRNIYYVVTIPPDFEEKCLEQGEKLPVTKIPGAYSAYYVDWQINSFLNDVRVLKAAGYQGNEIYEKAAKFQEKEAQVELMDKSGHGGAWAPHSFMFQTMPYAVFSVICYVLSYVTIGFLKEDVRMRMKCAAMPPGKQERQLLLGYLVFGTATWAIFILAAIGMYGRDFLSDAHRMLYMANVFAMVLVSLAAAFTMAVLIRKPEAVNGVVNVVSLGMGFTCGVFVSMDVLGSGVKAAARFLPFYWYEIVNQILAGNAAFTSSQRMEVLQGLGIQVLFAVTIVCVGAYIDRHKVK